MSPNVPVIPLQDISDHARKSHLTIADCTGLSVLTTIRAIDDGVIFRSDKTYLLVGLSGEIGQSLCKWMVKHGARYVVLPSRTPKVNSTFASVIKRMGGTVKILPMDVTSRESLHACYNAITKTLPPIAGVANGAMVLHDMVFDNMPFEVLDKVLAPKVKGSQLLDELFHDTPLDFFIFFSSMTVVLGNSGQSNYIAGNMFMNALAAQRKKRGVAGSSINISSVIGIGYVERSDELNEEYFTNMGYRPMSEQDLQLSFAEAIVLGKPDCPEVSELSTGVKSTLNSQSVEKFLQDIKFTHMMMQENDGAETVGTKSSSAPIKIQLAEVRTKADAVSIIRGMQSIDPLYYIF